MFDKVKQAKELLKMRGEAKKLQEQLALITHSEEGKGMRVKVTGDQKIEYIEIDGSGELNLKVGIYQSNDCKLLL